MKKNGITLIEWMFLTAILSTVLGLFAPLLIKFVGVDTVYSEGERTGVIVKLSKKGFFWKTWEGEMNLGGMSVDGGGVAVPNHWRFSISDEELAKEGLLLAAGAKRTTIRYKELWKAAFSQGETDYIAVGFRGGK